MIGVVEHLAGHPCRDYGQLGYLCAQLLQRAARLGLDLLADVLDPALALGLELLAQPLALGLAYASRLAQ